MSRLTDQFLFNLVISGKTEKEASHILANIVIESIKELYQAKNLDEESAQILENKLKRLHTIGAPQEILFNTLGVTPSDLEIKLKEKIINYQFL